jgi:hypothetical protein
LEHFTEVLQSFEKWRKWRYNLNINKRGILSPKKEIFMKKFLAILFVLAVCVTGVFAADTEFPTGTWIDENWDAKWVFTGDKVELFDEDDELVYAFTLNNTKDFTLVPTTEGLVLSFYCAETNRAYKFIKPISFSADLKMIINPDWTDKDYEVTIKFSNLKF